MYTRMLFILWCLFTTTVAASGQPTFEAYAKLPEISQMAISPDASRIAFRRTDGVRDFIFILDAATNERVGVVDVAAVKPNHLYFIDNDRVVMVTSQNTRIGGYKGRHDISTAAVYNIAKNKLHILLQPGYGIYPGQSQLGKIVGISPDGKYAYMPAYESPGAYVLYRVNLDRKREPRVHARGTADTIDFFVGPDGEVIARERYHNKTNLHRIQARIDGKWVNIFEEETKFMTKGFRGLTPDYKHLVMISQDKEHGRWAYYTMELATGKISGPIFSHEDKDVEHVITGIDRVVHGVAYSGFTPSYEFFNKKLNARMRGIAKAMPNNTFAIKDFTADWNNILFFMNGENTAGSYITYNTGALNYVASSRNNIKPDQVHKVTAYEYQARDGMTIPALITTPNHLPAKNLPAIMLPHGGPEAYDRIGFDYKAQFFASKGYVVIQPQFRGSTGFGPHHLSAGRGEWGRKMQDDLTDAVVDLAEQGIIDKNRVCIVGGSYGGYAALAGAAFTPDVYQCAVSVNGVSDIKRMLKTERADHGRHHWVVSYWEEVISRGDVQEDYLESISPVNFADKVKIPVLLLHGERDMIVKVKQSEYMQDALEDAGKDVTYIELNDGDHHLSNAQNRMAALEAIDAFVSEHL